MPRFENFPPEVMAGLMARTVPKTVLKNESLNWDDLKVLRKLWPRTLMVKGVLSPQDAVRAADCGADAVIVSNHGGRQLDHGRGAMDILPEVMSTVRGKTLLFVDGGFTRGTDIVKALAMGADGVGLGRLQALALGAAGREGVVRMLELLETEMMVAMKLLGVTKIDELDGNYLHPTVPVARPEPFGAFPLLDGAPKRE